MKSGTRIEHRWISSLLLVCLVISPISSWGASKKMVQCRSLLEIPEGNVAARNGMVVTQKMVIQVIRAYARKGLRLNSSSMQADRDLQFAMQVSYDEVGAHISPRILFQVSQKKSMFGSWSGALEAAGFDPQFIRKRGQWSYEKIIDALIHLQKKGISIREVDMKKSRPEADQTLSVFFNHPLTANYFYEMVLEVFYERWDLVLRDVQVAVGQR